MLWAICERFIATEFSAIKLYQCGETGDSFARNIGIKIFDTINIVNMAYQCLIPLLLHFTSSVQRVAAEKRKYFFSHCFFDSNAFN